AITNARRYADLHFFITYAQRTGSTIMSFFQRYGNFSFNILLTLLLATVTAVSFSDLLLLLGLAEWLTSTTAKDCFEEAGKTSATLTTSSTKYIIQFEVLLILLAAVASLLH